MHGNSTSRLFPRYSLLASLKTREIYHEVRLLYSLLTTGNLQHEGSQGKEIFPYPMELAHNAKMKTVSLENLAQPSSC